MIKVKTELGHVNAEISGNVVELAADSMAIIKTVNDSLLEKDEESAEAYRKMIVFMVESIYREVSE